MKPGTNVDIFIIVMGMAAAVLVITFFSMILCSCATTKSYQVDSDPVILKICLQECSERYFNCRRIKHYQRISSDVIRCVCITSSGDHRHYLNYKEYEIEGNTNVEIDTFKP